MHMLAHLFDVLFGGVLGWVVCADVTRNNYIHRRDLDRNYIPRPPEKFIRAIEEHNEQQREQMKKWQPLDLDKQLHDYRDLLERTKQQHGERVKEAMNPDWRKFLRIVAGYAAVVLVLALWLRYAPK